MGTHARPVGPGPERDGRPGPEAAGPATPRLVVEEVSVHLDSKGAEARVCLTAGARRFVGSTAARGQAHWQLAAAAAVEATQHYLQQCQTPLSAPHIHVLAAALDSTRLGQEIIHVTVRFTEGDSSSCLLGSALVRNDRCSTAVAAALDATSRRVSRYALPSPALPEPPPSFEAPAPEPEPPEVPELSFGPAAAVVPEAELLPVAAGDALELAPEPELEVAPEPEPEPTAELAPPALHVAPRTDAYVLGLGIGLTSISAAALDPEGNPVVQIQRAARPADPEGAVRTLVEAAQEAITRLNSHADRLEAVGLAAPGLLEPAAGVCVSCQDFPLWKDVQLVQPMADELQLPVELLGVAQAAALAETRFGAARGLSDVLFVHVGTDIAAAAVTGGHLLVTGPAGGRDVGHLAVEPEGPLCRCGAAGCWAALAGQEALVSRAVEAIEGGARTTLGAASNGRRAAITPAAICKAAAAGDPAARAALEQTGKYLALGLGNLITMLDPEAVILESAPSTVGAALRRAVENALKASPRAAAFSRCVLLSPELGEGGAALGAAAWRAGSDRE